MTTLPAMAAKVITLRSQLKSSIGDFLTDAEMACGATEESLILLAVALVNYREEERPLFPRVLICDDLHTSLRNLQGSNAIELGSGAKDPATVLRAVKKCAPLAANVWAIWIERRGDSFRFGVFQGPTATALDLRATLLGTEATGPLKAILIGQYAPGVVELISAGDPGIRIHLSGQREEHVPVDDTQSSLVGWSSKDIEDQRVQETYVSFMRTVLHDLLRKGHGTLIGVVPADTEAWKQDTDDIVILAEPIDLARLLEQHAIEQSSGALSELLASVELVEGMLNSDGITVFDSAGRVIAFNWFIATDLSKLSPRDAMGGARHRAFAAMKQRVEDGAFRGAFIRSSDGGEQAFGGDAGA